MATPSIMYKVRPYFVVKKVKLPDCMYPLKPIHNLPSTSFDQRDDIERAVDSLEERQCLLFSNIKKLQEEIIQIAQNKFGITSDNLQRLVESHVPGDVPIDIVINCSTSHPPHDHIMTLRHFISVPTVIQSFRHSSARNNNEIPHMTSSDNNNPSNQAKVKITLIWKDDDPGMTPVMIVLPYKQVPIKGIANICRYLSRQFSPGLYELFDVVKSSMVDSWLDSFSYSYINGNAKEKASVLRHMNSCLGNASYLIGDEFSLADLVIYCSLSRDSNKMPSNVKSWMKRCHSLPQVQHLTPHIIDN